MKREIEIREAASGNGPVHRRRLRDAGIFGFAALAGLPIAFALLAPPASAQSPDSQAIQRAQTVHIPVSVFQADGAPSAALASSNFRLSVDGKPRPFTLGRPEANLPIGVPSGTKNAPVTIKPVTINLLIIVPYGSLEDRSKALKEAEQVFTRMSGVTAGPPLAWNVSILDDSGQQSPYTKDLKEIAADLERIRHQPPQGDDWNAWRLTEWQAIASMKMLPGRRAVLSLGDLFHVELRDNFGYESSEYRVPKIASTAHDAGAVIYAADTTGHILRDKHVEAQYRTVGSGPWMLVGPGNVLEGWITKSAAAAMAQIGSDGKASYALDVHLASGEMNGLLHKIAVQVVDALGAVFSAPTFYCAPNSKQLALLAKAPARLRNALISPPPNSPLQLATQLSYFPHVDGTTGTQAMTTGFYWLNNGRPPPHISILLELMQTDLGFPAETILTEKDWNAQPLLWRADADLAPGPYLLRVAAASPSGEVIGGTSYPFSVAPSVKEPILISSLVLGSACIFHAVAPAGDGEERASSRAATSAAAGRDKPPPPVQHTDYLQAGHCVLQPNPSGAYSPDDIVWTLVRMTPTGKLTTGPSKEWKGSFTIVDEKNSKKAESAIEWIPQPDHSYVASTAFPLGNLKLHDGQYAVIFSLSGPGVENGGFEEDSPFNVVGPVADSKTRP